MSLTKDEIHTDSDYAARAIDELPVVLDGFIKLARSGLGITAFGVQVMDLPPDSTTESHDEADTGQQELYVALRGSGAVVIGEERLALRPPPRVEGRRGHPQESG